MTQVLVSCWPLARSISLSSFRLSAFLLTWSPPLPSNGRLVSSHALHLSDFSVCLSLMLLRPVSEDWHRDLWQPPGSSPRDLGAGPSWSVHGHLTLCPSALTCPQDWSCQGSFQLRQLKWDLTPGGSQCWLCSLTLLGGYPSFWSIAEGYSWIWDSRKVGELLWADGEWEHKELWTCISLITNSFSYVL